MAANIAIATPPRPAAPSALPRDEEIVARVVAGERALFELLMRRHNRRVYRAVRAILRDEAESEDAMQATYLAAFSHLGDFQGDSAFATWLTRIALNEAFGRVRRRAGITVVPEEDLAGREEPARDEPDPERRAAAREMIRAVERALDQLPVGYRTIVMLRDVEGLSTADAAASLGIAEDAAKVRLMRARRALRGELAAALGSEATTAFAFDAVRCDRIVAAVMGRLAAGG